MCCRDAAHFLYRDTQLGFKDEQKVRWKFADIACTGPWNWSGNFTLSHAIHDLLLAKHNGHEDLPVQIDFMETGETEDYDDVPGAIHALKHLKRQDEIAKETERMKNIDVRFQTKFKKPRPAVNHVVVLLLENRTFDGLQGDYMNDRYKSGEVKRSKWDMDGKDLYSYINKVDNGSGQVMDFPVWTRARNDPHIFKKEYMAIPSGPAGPVEKFHFLNLCVYEVMRPEDKHLAKGPTMGGFAQQYYLKTQANPNEDGTINAPELAATCFKSRHSPAMYVYNKNQTPVFTDIMENFGCSDVHFSSAPCQTWPNRLFAVCGTCFGYYNNIPYVNPNGDEDETAYFQSDDIDKWGTMEKIFSSYDTDTIFHRLDDHSVSWGIYHGQVSLAVITTRLKYELPSIAGKVHTLLDFAEDCKNGDLPQFSWIEPNYDSSSPDENDMHPPSNVLSGQHLIKDIYNSLRGNKDIFRSTVFIVTCDEGVGQFDHVRPPRAVDPEVGQGDHEYKCQLDGSPYDMTSNPFTRFGTRTPNLIVSPFIKARSVVRPTGPKGDEASAPYPFDHTSIIRTAFDLLIGDPEEHLTERDKVAPSFVHCLGLSPDNMGPPSLGCPDYEKESTDCTVTCHGVSSILTLTSGEDQAFGIQGCFKVPHALQPTFTVELASFFGL